MSSESDNNRLHTSGDIQSDGVEFVSCLSFLAQLPLANIAPVPLGQQHCVRNAAAISFVWWSADVDAPKSRLHDEATALNSIVCRSNKDALAIGGDDDLRRADIGGDSSGFGLVGGNVAKSMPLAAA